MRPHLFTSESVCKGHPDKIADQIADAILDRCLEEDKNSRVSCNLLLSQGLLYIAGQITTKANFDYALIARQVINEIGYSNPALQFDSTSLEIIVRINKQSQDIANAIKKEGVKNQKLKNEGAGDQGIVFGYASDETEELMPLPILTAHKIVRQLSHLYQSKNFPYLRPDGKCQVTFEYDQEGIPRRLNTLVLSVQHEENISHDILEKEMKKILLKMIPKKYLDEKTKFIINPSGRFVIGGPVADTGMTGRKIIVDTYGGISHHGGGAFSGKDGTKIDRTAAYMARYVAKNIVAANLAKRCEVELSYAIGQSLPLSIRVDTFGTGEIPEEMLEEAVLKIFPLSPGEMIEALDLRRPQFQKTAFGGHFGRENEGFNWEKKDRVAELKAFF